MEFGNLLFEEYDFDQIATEIKDVMFSSMTLCINSIDHFSIMQDNSRKELQSLINMLNCCGYSTTIEYHLKYLSYYFLFYLVC